MNKRLIPALAVMAFLFLSTIALGQPGGGGPSIPGGTPAVPIDGGLTAVLAGGAALGYKLMGKKKSK